MKRALSREMYLGARGKCAARLSGPWSPCYNYFRPVTHRTTASHDENPRPIAQDNVTRATCQRVSDYWMIIDGFVDISKQRLGTRVMASVKGAWQLFPDRCAMRSAARENASLRNGDHRKWDTDVSLFIEARVIASRISSFLALAVPTSLNKRLANLPFFLFLITGAKLPVKLLAILKCIQVILS